MTGNNQIYMTLETTLQFIEENIKKKILLDHISGNSHISKYHLNRIFKAITGQPLMNYVRQRKLSCSIFELLNTNMKIIDISCEYGFEYEQSYIRSFINFFGTSPDRFRKEKSEIKITDRLNTQYLKAIGTSGLVTEPSIKIIPTFRLLGIKNKINIAEDKNHFLANKAGNDFYFNHLPRIEKVMHRDIYYSHIEILADEPDFVHYTPSIRVPKEIDVPHGMSLRTVPTNKYAVFKYVGMHHPKFVNTSNLYSLFEYIFGEWFPKSGYRMNSPYQLEKIDSRIGKDDYCEVELLFPVKLSE